MSDRPALSPALAMVAGLLRPCWRRWLALSPLLLFQAGFFLFVPVAFKMIFDQVIAAGDHERLGPILLALALGFLLTTFADLLLAWLAARLGTAMTNDLRARMFVHLQQLSMQAFSRSRPGDLLARFTGDLHAIERLLSASLYKMGLNLLTITSSAVLLFVLEWRLALAVLVAVPLTALGPRLLGSRAAGASLTRREEEARAVDLVQEQIGAQETIRAFGLEGTYRSWFERRLAQLRAAGVRANLLGAYVERTASLGIVFVQLFAVGLGAWLAIAGHLTAGTLVGFVGVLLNIGDGVGALTGLFPDWIQAAGGLTRVRSLLEAPREEDDDAQDPKTGPIRFEDDAGAPRDLALARQIRFEDVRFSYDGQGCQLEGLSLTIPAGASVAFVGRSGAGKSTLFRLLTRFYDPTAGAIRIDGRDLRTIPRPVLRSAIGVVLQDSVLARTTLRENIRLGRLEATDAEVEAAARAAEIHHDVAALPEGYDTVAGGGLSGGQRQRLALARAILRNPKILLLDEATSALDPVTETAIQATLRRLSGDRTVITITHRLSWAVNMDRVFVLDGGRLVEQGTHKELLNLKGVYYAMWQDFTLELTQDVLVGGSSSRRADGSPGAAVPAASKPHLRELEERLADQEREIARLRRLNHSWTRLAGTDALTGLPNKLAFLQALASQEVRQAQSRKEPVSFLLIAGDNLGLVNEAHGRDAGDEILRQLAAFLRAALRGEEQLGHLDGTHFAVILSPASLDVARARAEALRGRVAAHAFHLAGERFPLTVSAAAASVDGEPGDPDRVVAAAFERLNRALYQAKRAGGDCVRLAAPAA